MQNSYKLVQTRIVVISNNIEGMSQNPYKCRRNSYKIVIICYNSPNISQTCHVAPAEECDRNFWATTRGHPRRYTPSYNSPYIAACRQKCRDNLTGARFTPAFSLANVIGFLLWRTINTFWWICIILEKLVSALYKMSSHNSLDIKSLFYVNLILCSF